ncbi:MAG: BlaI/MecI/CopY family transcriptional regulator [Proteobacteria bacterium]|nr:BlaI/MecI/CopY family transcriptional regulator [Pseudomonadota bacterium]
MRTKHTELPTISDAELEILQVLWRESPLPADAIIQHLQQRRDAHPRTIKTLINRLLKKNAIGFHEKNRKYHYYPLVDKVDFYSHKTDSFLQRFFDGQLTPLVSFFSEEKKLSEEDLKELKSLIEKIEADDADL